MTSNASFSSQSPISAGYLNERDPQQPNNEPGMITRNEKNEEEEKLKWRCGWIEFVTATVVTSLCKRKTRPRHPLGTHTSVRARDHSFLLWVASFKLAHKDLRCTFFLFLRCFQPFDPCLLLGTVGPFRCFVRTKQCTQVGTMPRFRDRSPPSPTIILGMPKKS